MVVPPNSDKWLLKWYPPIKQPFGVYSSGVDMIKFIPCPDAKVLKKPPVMIQHSHAHLGCSRSLPLALSHLHLEMDPIRDSVNRNHPSQMEHINSLPNKMTPPSSPGPYTKSHKIKE